MCQFLILCIAIFLQSMILANLSATEEIPYGTGVWDADAFGNHRAVVRVDEGADAVRVRIPWRRSDQDPEKKNIIIIDAKTKKRIRNVARIDINREFGDLAFQPESGPGNYHAYYLPYAGSIKSHYPIVHYPEPKETAEAEWLLRVNEMWKELPRARVIEIQSIDDFNSYHPMEVIAARTERNDLLSRHPDAAYLIFPEDRTRSIRMTDDLPHRWIKAGPKEAFRGKARRGEFYAFQIGVFAARKSIEDVDVRFADLKHVDKYIDAAIPADAFRCFNLGGVDWSGRKFRRKVPVREGKVQALWCGVQVPLDTPQGAYEGQIRVRPKGLEESAFSFFLQVSPDKIKNSGDDEPSRLSRLRWLDSQIALDDGIVPPFTPMEVRGNQVSVLGRTVTVGENGFPRGIRSFFAPEMTHILKEGREILAGPIDVIVDSKGAEHWESNPPRFIKKTEGAVAWECNRTADPLQMDIRAKMEFDGCIEFEVALRAREKVSVKDIRLEIPIVHDAAKYMMGLGRKGGFSPYTYDWKWNIERNQDSAWIGDVNAGLQFTLKDENYSRPLNTNFYRTKPLVMPSSWCNGGAGGVRLAGKEGGTYLVRCYSGSRTMSRGEVLHYNFRLLLTPFKPIDARSHWTNRYYHRYADLDEIAASGANVINVHHATPINPYINYPFLRPGEMKGYADAAHERGFKVKIYYTVRELSNRAPELFALGSLGDEILADGPGGGHSWLQEHLRTHYISGWFVHQLKDAAVINSGMSRWHNYYLEGLDWLAKNVGIDGLYIDDVAFDRTVMMRARKILDRNRPGGLIDLHSANQYNERDGFASSANLYLEHFPFLNRLWFGEYFDYNGPLDYWLVEMSGIPFGLMGEMLQDGGNPWRGMVFGMTSRLPWAGDPRPLWKAWDDFGIRDSRMIGYWSPACPVKTDRLDVPATCYVKKDKTMIALASWAEKPVQIKLTVDWNALGIAPEAARIIVPAIQDFQREAAFNPGVEISVDPGKGRLLVIEAKDG